MPSFPRWLRSLANGRKLTPARRKHTRLNLETLEDRVTPSTTITFSEPRFNNGSTPGFNGRTNNDYLISSDGSYKVETFWTTMNGGHFHVYAIGNDPTNLAEHNHNQRSNSTTFQGLHITRWTARYSRSSK